VLFCTHPTGALLALRVLALLASLATVVLGRMAGALLAPLLSGIVVVVVSHWIGRSRVGYYRRAIQS